MLADGVVLLPVRDLSEEFRRGLQAGEDDFAISRPNSRTPSKIIESTAAELIRQFDKPHTIAQAVARYSRGRAGNAEQLLEDALPLLRSLIEAGVLVLPDSDGRLKIQASLNPGDAIEGWRVVRCIQTLDDTELYLVREAGGKLGALKIGRSGSDARTRRLLTREAGILSGLDGAIAPRLLQSGERNSRLWFIAEWLLGVDPQTACAEFGRDAESGLSGRVTVAGAILQTYARLHELGAIHGDVHPGNVLVDRGKSVRIVDFGFARRATETAADVFGERAGIGFFFEPEFARSVTRGAEPPSSSMAGEQYAVAAMLYLLVTGAYYLDFSLEREEMMRQIAEDPMAPFSRRGLDAWPEMEEVLGKALSKDPGDRYPSMRACAEAWDRAAASCAIKEEPGKSKAVFAQEATLREMRTKLMQRIGFGGPLLSGEALPPPAASLNYGSAGIAYGLYRMACSSEKADLLALADVWSARSIREIVHDEVLYSEDLKITPETVGRRSLFHSAVGVHAVQALIAQARGDARSLSMAVNSFVTAAEYPCDGPELGLGLDITLGRAGILLACSSLLGVLPAKAKAGEDLHEPLRALGRRMLSDIWGKLDRFPPISDSKELSLLGIAHGWAGLLYATMCWCALPGNPIPSGLSERLEQLAECAEPAGRGMQWKWDFARSASEPGGGSAPGWCNGSAGYVYLWTQAHMGFAEPGFLQLAEGAAWNAWETRHGTGDLCCGLAGQAYALLNLYRHTGEAVWLRRACDLSRNAAEAAAYASSRESREQPAPRPESLYKGELGIIVLDSDLNQPEFARMPMFESEA